MAKKKQAKKERLIKEKNQKKINKEKRLFVILSFCPKSPKRKIYDDPKDNKGQSDKGTKREKR